MSRSAWLCLLFLVPVLAAAGTREEYARQWLLTAGQADAGAYRVVLDEAVYRSATQPSLRDLEVFNTSGQPMPAALLSPAQPLAQPPRTLDLPWFALPDAGRRASGDIRLIAERSADGGILRVEAGTVAGPDAPSGDHWLVDASRLREPVRALLLEWEAPAQPLQAGYRVEGSDDLSRWRTLNAGTTLLDLQRDGQRLRQGRIELDGQARYLRLLPTGTGTAPGLTGVRAELAPPAAQESWQWLEISGERRRQGGRDYFEFVLPGRFPVARADVRLPGNSAVEWTLYSREDADAGWAWRAGPWMAYEVGTGADAASRSAPKALSAPVRDRHWRLAAATPTGEAEPVLRLGYRPEVVVFLAQGAPPYALAAGSGNAQRADAPIPALLEALRRQRGPGWQPAPAYLADAPQELAGERALRSQRTYDWKAWLLWSLLIVGAVAVAGLGMSLLRKRPSPE